MNTLSADVHETRTVLRTVTWQTFVELAEQRGGSIPRMTYDNGVLELMNPKRKHENIGRLIGRMIETYSEVKMIEILSVASVTVKRSDLQKAFEADESYFVTHAAEVLEKEELDFELDPAPDLVVEVELTSSAIDKLKLFRAMQVQEVWRHDGSSLQMYRLIKQDYERITSSIELPGLASQMIDQTLSKRLQVGETTLMRQFRNAIQGS